MEEALKLKRNLNWKMMMMMTMQIKKTVLWYEKNLFKSKTKNKQTKKT